jgi:hypothetical protein
VTIRRADALEIYVRATQRSELLERAERFKLRALLERERGEILSQPRIMIVSHVQTGVYYHSMEHVGNSTSTSRRNWIGRWAAKQRFID